MRVRVIRSAKGEIDGIPLETFEVGLSYDVPSVLATYLITTGAAHPVIDEAPALVVPVSELRMAVPAEPPAAVSADTGAPATAKPKSLAGDSGSTH